jgi:hypothetical protein
MGVVWMVKESSGWWGEALVPQVPEAVELLSPLETGTAWE